MKTLDSSYRLCVLQSVAMLLLKVGVVKTEREQLFLPTEAVITLTFFFLLYGHAHN